LVTGRVRRRRLAIVDAAGYRHDSALAHRPPPQTLPCAGDRWRARGRRAAVGMAGGGAAVTAALAQRCLCFGPFSLPEVRNLLKQSLIRRMLPSGP
jgi:hypothetical protein